MNKKRGELSLSFGMIFSIILIVAFIAFAFYAITKFLDFQSTIKIQQFADNLQSDVDNLWRSSDGSQEVEYNLPAKIEEVCFRIPEDDYETNMYLNPKMVYEKDISHIDIDAITDGEDSVCFENVRGKVNMVLKKDFDDVLVTISRLT